MRLSAELERPAREAAAGRGMGEMRGDPGRRAALPGPGPGALPAVWDIGNMALEYGPEYGVYHADTCREICCSRLKFHKGILKVETMMLMRILMNSAGAMCAHVCA